MWRGINFELNWYYEYNRILVKVYTNFYYQCWIYQNNYLNNSNLQREQIIKWYQNEKQNAIKMPIYQVKRYVKNRIINVETSLANYIRKWIIGLKNIKCKAEKSNTDDIRIYFS